MRKSCFHCSFAKYSFLELADKPPYVGTIKMFCDIWSFCEIYVFPFDVISIHNSNLHSLKGNGNTGCVSISCLAPELMNQ